MGKIIEQHKGIKLVQWDDGKTKIKKFKYNIDIYDVDDSEGRINKIEIFCKDIITAEAIFTVLTEAAKENKITGFYVSQ